LVGGVDHACIKITDRSLLVYYLILFGGAWLVIRNNPELQSYCRSAGPNADQSGAANRNALERSSAGTGGQVARPEPRLDGGGHHRCADHVISGDWVYMATRTSDEYDQSIISTILILPSVVTSIVVVVQHSLALAFALGGIAGACASRTASKARRRALHIAFGRHRPFAGIGAVELALVMSLAFNYCFMALWISEYGERQGMKRYLSDFSRCRPASAPAAIRQPPNLLRDAAPPKRRCSP
jgi:hypothetical protein